MALPTIPTTLKRGVGRKILSLFLLASLLPVFFTAGLAYFEIQRSTEAEIGRTLRASAKDYGLDLLGRLQRASLAAGNVQSMFEREGISFTHPSRFILVGTMNPEEGELRPQLLDRFALSVEIHGIRDLRERVQIMERNLAFEQCRENIHRTLRLTTQLSQFFETGLMLFD